MMKKVSLIALAVIVLAALLFTGCSGDKETVISTVTSTVTAGGTTETATTTATSVTTVPQEVFHLKMDKATAETATSSQMEIAMTDRVRERTNGGLDIQIYFSSTLVDSANTTKALETGLIDMAGYGFGSNPGAHWLNMMPRMDFIGWTSGHEAYELWPMFREKWAEEFQRDLKNVKNLGTRFFANGDMINITSKLVRVPEDLEGLKINQRGEEFAIAMASVGAAALDLQTPDIYNALERGLIDGNCWPPAVVRAFRTGELYKYHVIFESINYKFGEYNYLMNMDVWDSLPEEYQQILVEEVAIMCQSIMDWELEDDALLLAEQEANGVELLYLTEEECLLWQELFVPTHEIFLSNCEENGFDNVREIYADLVRFLDTYRETGEIVLYP
jgi:TRAP-type C4-dicarboxylate transport system substrate-binding protein